jgi:DnaJ-class molecular chaperone
MDPYLELGVDVKSTLADIKQAFRTRARQWHPDKNNNSKESVTKFQNINSAYETLSDNVKRRDYDARTNRHLRNQTFYFTPSNDGGATFHFNTTRRTFYHAPLSKQQQKGFFDQRATKQKQTKTVKDITVSVACSLEELFTGSTKRITMARHRKVKGENRLVTELKVFDVAIDPGYTNGVKILYQKEGHQTIEGQSSDVIFIIRETAHPDFKRKKNNDVLYTKKLTLVESLSGFKFQISYLHGKMLDVDLSGVVVHPKTVTTVPKMGFVSMKNPKTRGDLIITYQIEFPTSTLSPVQRQNFDRILKI